MRKILMILALSLVLVFGLALQSWANLDSITNISGSGKYVITSFTPGAAVFENYGNVAFPPGTDFNLIPFASHDGFALVDLSSSGSIFFDKSITISSNAANFDHEQFTFHINNNSKFAWSDYHFILLFEDGDSIIPGNINFSTPNANDSDLKGQNQVKIGDNIVEIDFFATDPRQYIQPGTNTNFSIGFDFDNPGSGVPLTFELRQIATAVPIPAALPLFGTGLLGLGLLGWRKVRS